MMILFQILLLLLLVAASAFFSSAEISLFSLPKARVLSWKKSPDKVSRIIYFLMRNGNRTLVTIILGNMFVNSAISMVNDSVMVSSGLPENVRTAVAALTAIVLLLFFGEITPMSLAYVFCEPWSRVAARPVLWLRILLTPVTIVTDRISDFILDLAGRAGNRPLTADEYESYMEICGRKGAFSPEEVNLLREELDFADKDAEEVMRPRKMAGFVPETASPEEAASRIREVRQKYLLVGKNSPDDADRILDAVRFFLLTPEERKNWSRSPAVFPAEFLPAGTSVMHAVRTMKKLGSRALLLSDEYGGAAGLVSEDELFLHLSADEKLHTQISEYGIEKSPDGSWIFDGTTPVDLAEEKLGLSFEEFDSNTLNGLLSELLKHLPEEGDQAEWNGFSFQAVTVTGKHADRIRIQKLPPAAEGAAE